METTYTVIKFTHLGDGEIMDTELVIRGRITPSVVSELQQHLKQTIVEKDNPDEVQGTARRWLEEHGFETIYHYWEQVWLY